MIDFEFKFSTRYMLIYGFPDMCWQQIRKLPRQENTYMDVLKNFSNVGHWF